MLKNAHIIRNLALFFGLTTAFAGCDATPNQQTREPPTTAFPASDTAGNTASKTGMDTGAQQAWSMQDLATRLGVDNYTVEVAGVREVTWRSGAVGCPEEGNSYTQALVDGALIELRVGQTVYRYHAVVGGQPFYCPAGRAETPAMGSGAD